MSDQSQEDDFFEQRDDIGSPAVVRKWQYDAIVVGGGHNGLVCANYLAKMGLEVVVVEARGVLGGMAVNTTQDHGSLESSDFAHLISGIPGFIVRDLKLNKFGLRFSGHGTRTVSIDEEGRKLTLSPTLEESRESIERLSRSDADKYSDFTDHWTKVAAALKRFVSMAPPPLELGSHTSLESLHGWLEQAARVSPDILKRAQSGLMAPVADIVEDLFETDLLRGTLAFDAVLGMNVGPRQAGTMLSYLQRLIQRDLAMQSNVGYPVGGMTAAINALAKSAQARNVEIMTDARVTDIRISDGRVHGVDLEGGMNLDAKIIVSSLDPKQTILSLAGVRHFDLEFIQKLRAIRSNGAIAKIDLQLSELPNITGLNPDEFRGRIVISPDIDYIERASAAIKYGEYALAPIAEIVFPSLFSEEAGETHHMSAIIQYVPYDIAGGWVTKRDQFEHHILNALKFYAPDLLNKVLDARIMTPADIEDEFGIWGGNWHHTEFSLDQFGPMRSMPELAQNKTPIEGLYLCGAGTHPGGGLTGLAGHNAARVISDAVKRRS